MTITAVSPAGDGNLRGWARSGAVPLASVATYGLACSRLNSANTTIVHPLQSTLNANEFTIRADASNVDRVSPVRLAELPEEAPGRPAGAAG